MKQHIAQLAPIEQFDRTSMTWRTLAAGVSVLYATRTGSKTEEGVAYAFDPETYTADRARGWLEARKIKYAHFAPADEGEEAKPPPMNQQPDRGTEDMPPSKEDMPRAEKMGAGPYGERDGLSPSLSTVLEAMFSGDDDRVDVEFEALVPGTFDAATGRVTITEEDVKRIAMRTNELISAGLLKPPQKLGHDMDQETVQKLFPSGGEPSLGWIEKLTLRGSSLWVKATQVPRKFVELINKGAWRTRSPEIAMRWLNPETKRGVPYYDRDCLAWCN